MACDWFFAISQFQIKYYAQNPGFNYYPTRHYLTVYIEDRLIIYKSKGTFCSVAYDMSSAFRVLRILTRVIVDKTAIQERFAFHTIMANDGSKKYPIEVVE